MSMGDANPLERADSSPQARDIALFSSTNFGKSLFWSTADIFCLVYATDTLGINPAAAGLIILCTLVWDAISDPIVGLVVDRSALVSSQHGAIIRLVAPIGAICLALTFCVHLMNGAVQTVAFVAALLLFRTAFTLVDIPDNALFARVLRAKWQRISGATLRKLMATGASVAISLSSGWVFADSGHMPEGTRILIVALLAGGVGTTAFIIGSNSVRLWDRGPKISQHPSWTGAILTLLRNQNIAALALHIVFSTLGMALYMSSLVYYARFILGHDAWFATAMTVFLISQACGVVVWGWVAAKTSSANAILIAALVALCAVISFLSVGHNIMLIGACGVFGFCAGGLNSLRWAIAPQVIDSVERTTLRRYEAGAMALFSLSVKTAIGAASLVLGVLLFALNYEAGDLATSGQATAFQIGVALVVCASIALGMLPIAGKAFQDT